MDLRQDLIHGYYSTEFWVWPHFRMGYGEGSRVILRLNFGLCLNFLEIAGLLPS